jgi:hypothetical protein
METTESMEHDGFIKAVSSQERDEKVSLKAWQTSRLLHAPFRCARRSSKSGSIGSRAGSQEANHLKTLKMHGLGKCANELKEYFTWFQMREEELEERIHRLESVALQEPPQNP